VRLVRGVVFRIRAVTNLFDARVSAARALKRNTQLEELGLADNYLDAKALTEFGNAVEVNSTLKTLNLSGVHKRSDILEDGG
jgi:hypothetical protein